MNNLKRKDRHKLLNTKIVTNWNLCKFIILFIPYLIPLEIIIQLNIIELYWRGSRGDMHY